MAFTPVDYIASYFGWTQFTPAIPSFYWNVYSAEERVMKICKELHKLCEYANMLADNINIDHTLIKELQDALANIENLDEINEQVLALQESADTIQETLDALPDYSEFAELQQRVEKKAYVFRTVNEMKNSDLLQNGDVVQTLGFHEYGDRGGGFYSIANFGTPNEMNIIELNAGLVAYLIKDVFMNPRQYGAYGDGTHDDTAAIQKCFDENHNIFFYDGVYLVDCRYYSFNGWRGKGLNPQSNTIIELSENATIQEVENTTGFYHILQLTDVHDIIIRGGMIKGDKTQPTMQDYGSEFGQCLKIYNCQNILVENIELCDGWGDGIEVGGTYPKGTTSDILIKDCNIHDCRRQGISLTDGSYITVDNCHIYNIAGTSPQYCIDIEGNPQGDMNEIHIQNCVLESELNFGVSFSVGVVSGTIEHTTTPNIIIPNDTSNTSKKIEIYDCVVKDAIAVGTGIVSIYASTMRRLSITTSGSVVNVYSSNILGNSGTKHACIILQNDAIKNTSVLNLFSCTIRPDISGVFGDAIIHAAYAWEIVPPNYLFEISFKDCDIDFNGSRALVRDSATTLKLSLIGCRIKRDGNSDFIASPYIFVFVGNTIYNAKPSQYFMTLSDQNVKEIIIANNIIDDKVSGAFAYTPIEHTPKAKLIISNNLFRTTNGQLPSSYYATNPSKVELVNTETNYAIGD